MRDIEDWGVRVGVDGDDALRLSHALHVFRTPGGYLLLGHSESLINLSTAFTLRTLRHDMVYQKPLRTGGG